MYLLNFAQFEELTIRLQSTAKLADSRLKNVGLASANT